MKNRLLSIFISEWNIAIILSYKRWFDDVLIFSNCVKRIQLVHLQSGHLDGANTQSSQGLNVCSHEAHRFNHLVKDILILLGMGKS